MEIYRRIRQKAVRTDVGISGERQEGGVLKMIEGKEVLGRSVGRPRKMYRRRVQQDLRGEPMIF